MSDLEEEVWCAEHPKEAAARIEALELEKGRLQTRNEALEAALRNALRVMDHPTMSPARQEAIDRASAALSASGSASSPRRWPPE